MSKKTKQGLRDLNDLPAKPKGIRLEEPPVVLMCTRHTFVAEASGYFLICQDCQYTIDPRLDKFGRNH